MKVDKLGRRASGTAKRGETRQVPSLEQEYALLRHVLPSFSRWLPNLSVQVLMCALFATGFCSYRAASQLARCLSAVQCSGGLDSEDGLPAEYKELATW